MFKQLDPHLRRFLWDRDLYFRFMINMIITSDSVADYIKRRTSLSVTKPHAIGIAFDWERSFEGEYYWNSVNRKWEIWYGVLLNAGEIEPYSNITRDEEEKSNV